jgi:nitrite transporter NirC
MISLSLLKFPPKDTKVFDRPHVEKAAHTGRVKIALLRDDSIRYVTRCVLAGMYLSIVVFVYWSLINDLGATPYGKLLGSMFFGVGLAMIVLTNTELFTSNNLYLAISCYEGTTTWRSAGALWGVCYIGNLLGAVIIASLLYATGIIDDLPANHALYVGALHKAHEAAAVIFWRGVLANWLVCLAVRLALRCHEEIAKIVILILVVFMFLYLGGEHSIANMATFSVALIGKSSLSLGGAMYNELFATLGNIVGGVLFIAIPFAYINPPAPIEMPQPAPATDPNRGHE